MSETVLQSETAVNHSRLLVAGYKRHERHGENSWLNHASALYQKKMLTDSGDVAFFLNVYWYDYRKYPHFPRPDGWMPEAQFNSRWKPTFDVTYHGSSDATTIEQIEDFYWKIYRLMECEPYERAGA